MKSNLLLLAIVSILTTSTYAVTKLSAATTGNYETAGSWTPAGVPAAGDSVVIRTGHTITVTNTNTITGAATKINVIGVLKFNNGNNPSLTLPSGSIVYVASGGQVQPGNSGKDRLFIGSGLVYSDNMNTLSGPLVSNGVAPLPLVWGKFSAQLQAQSQVVLNWQILAESDNARFVIERAGKDGNFKPVGEVKSLGDISSSRNYSFTDRTASGEVFYQIRQVDYNGNSSYSSTIKVQAAETPAASIAVYPNPVTDVLNLETNGATVIFTLRDVTGKVVKMEEIATSTIPVAELPQGIYFYTAVCGEQMIASGKILK